ncbi:MAG: hypothetical protein ACJ76T_04210, partial [Solirubrobacteraceae bacterium]
RTAPCGRLVPSRGCRRARGGVRAVPRGHRRRARGREAAVAATRYAVGTILRCAWPYGDGTALAADGAVARAARAGTLVAAALDAPSPSAGMALGSSDARTRHDEHAGLASAPALGSWRTGLPASLVPSRAQ